jgi:hypothetical protein
MINQLKHILNSLHVYCRLRELGLSKKRSMRIISFYEIKIYNRIFGRNKTECK